MNITIYDIAKKCGVSIATVSRVLNGSSRVSEKTRARVMETMKEMGYKPNPFARGLGLDSMKIVGVICTDVADIFYARAVSLLEEGLRRHQLDVMLANTGVDTGRNSKYVTDMAEKHVDAIITIGTPFSSEMDIRQLQQVAESVPIITINCDYHLPNMYSVVCNEKEGMRCLVHALADKGCSAPLYLYDVLTYSGRHKLDGFHQACRELGWEQATERVRRIERSLEAAGRAVDEAAAQCRFDAIVTSEDILAVGAQRAMFRNGLTMPVVGWNNSVLAQCATPTLSSVDNKLDSLCAAAVNIVIALTENNSAAVPVRTEFRAELAERESFRRA